MPSRSLRSTEGLRGGPAPGTFHIESLGCAKNQVDSERMIAALERAGWRMADGEDDADVLIVNTCGFITSAKKESIETSLGLKQRHPGKRVIMVGCLSERYGDLAAQMPEIDGFLGNREPAGILDLLTEGEGARGAESRPTARGRRSEGAARQENDPFRTRLLSFPGSAYVKIAEGCSNRCTYCAIPLIRGDLASRAAAEIVEEARALLERGIRELILIAQDLGSYGNDRAGSAGLHGLLEDLSHLPGRFWVRLLYIHPDRFPLPILDLMRRDARFLPYFDIPFQHGAASILGAMGRRADVEANVRLIARIREALPHAVIRTTFLVGFPGETDDDVRDLLSFQRRIRPDWMGCFAYSREEDTPAYAMPRRVASGVANKRKALLEERQVPITAAALDAFVGWTVDVLIEENVSGEDLSLGRAFLHAPDVDGLVVVHGSPAPGSIVSVRLQRRNGVDLEGSPVGDLGGSPRE